MDAKLVCNWGPPYQTPGRAFSGLGVEIRGVLWVPVTWSKPGARAPIESLSYSTPTTTPLSATLTPTWAPLPWPLPPFNFEELETSPTLGFPKFWVSLPLASFFLSFQYIVVEVEVGVMGELSLEVDVDLAFFLSDRRMFTEGSGAVGGSVGAGSVGFLGGEKSA